jgi:DNA-directed RNA polymerase II subunit RPB2
MISSYELDMFARSIIKEQKLNAHQINSFNNFLDVGLKQIMEQLFEINTRIDLNNKLQDNVNYINCNIRFINIKYKRPTMSFHPINKLGIITPNLARKTDIHYLVEINYSVAVTLTIHLLNNSDPIVKTHTIDNLSFNLPTMVKSKGCHLHELSVDELIELEEDPHDPGGYFILGGREWGIDLLESKKFNWPHIHNTTGYERELTRLDIICKAGDAYEHSSEIILKLLNTFNLTVSFTSHSVLKLLPIPFYLIYRVYGIVTDVNIMKLIASFTESSVLQSQMFHLLQIALNTGEKPFEKMQNVIEPDKILEGIAVRLVSDVPANKMRQLTEFYESHLLGIFDDLLFPHIGKTPADRPRKLQFLSWLIYKLLLVNLKVVTPTDRDSYVNKRIHTTGIICAKAFKSLFNLDINQKLKNKFANELNKNSYLNLTSLDGNIKSTLNKATIEKSIIKSIIMGSKEIKVGSNILSNKVPSEMMIRKNNINIITSERTIRTSTVGASKQDVRADEMRRVHPTQLGFVCPIQSADTGESVGIVKQLAISTIISFNQDSSVFKQFLFSDPDIYHLDDVDFLTIQAKKLAIVFVNGAPIAFTAVPQDIVYRFRQYRRGYTWDHKGKEFKKVSSLIINPYTSIYWDLFANIIYFWIDHGRMMKPYLIVRNNTDTDPIGKKTIKGDSFRQELVLKREHFGMSIEELQKESVIEYLSHDEIDNMLISISHENLLIHETNILMQYTHCDVPFTNFGLAALTCPFATCNQAPRITFQTNQTKQTIGIPTLNRQSRTDKHAYYALSCNTPLVMTINNDILYPNGLNEITAVMSRGFNQEDSLEVNSTSMRRGKFQCVEENFMKITLEQNEKFGKIDRKMTATHINANYGKLGGNIHVPKFTRIQTNDVIICKYIELKDTYKDTSEIYQGFEDIIITDIIFIMTSDNREACKIKYYTLRVCSVGDKFSTRHGQKGSVSRSLNQSMMPFTQSGLIPDKIINTLALPARMTIGQILEGLVSIYCAETGTFVYGTMFQKINVDDIGDRLEEIGHDRWGIEQMYDGVTGYPLGGKGFIAPVVYQKLPKFSNSEVRATSNDGPISMVSRQPLEGKSNDGGLRYGEMEKDTALASGGMFFPLEKMREDSDGFMIYICRRCKQLATVNEEKKIYNCNFCTPRMPDIVKVYSTWVTKNFLQSLASSGIGTKLYVEEHKL